MTNETKNLVAASELSDEQIIQTVARVASHSLNITRAHEIGGKTTTIMDETGVIEITRAVLAAATPAASVPVTADVLADLSNVRQWMLDVVPAGTDFTISKIAKLDRVIAALAAPAVQQPAEGGWISVDERLPEVPEDDGEEFNITCRRTNGKSYVFSAYYLNSKGVISDDDPETVFMGWYLRTEHPDYDGWYTPVCDAGDVVTHWQPLPAPPRERA